MIKLVDREFKMRAKYALTLIQRGNDCMPTQRHMDELRDRRSKLLRQKEWERLRKAHGASLVKALSLTTDVPLTLDAFKTDVAPPFTVSLLRRLEESPGLVAAYVSKEHVISIACCIETKLKEFEGVIGIHCKDYLGICDVSQISMRGLIEAAEVINETVVFYPKHKHGAILVDCYSSNPGHPFSVVAQGEGLIPILKACFDGS